MNVYIARQPIFNKKREVVAYELLFRSTEKNAFDNTDSTHATLQVIKNSFSLFSMESLIGDKTAFLNFDENLINSDIIDFFSPEMVVVEILETVTFSQEVINSIKRLKQKGFKIALDDFLYNKDQDEIMDMVDFIKIDFLLTRGEERKDIVKKFNNGKIKFLAEKVETKEDLDYAAAAGYTYFQGYYLSAPLVLTTKELFTNKINYLSVVEELNNQCVDIIAVENSIKKDLGLSYKLLKLINCASYGFKTEISSIRQAIVLIGVDNLKKWLYVITLESLTENRQEPIITISLIRARFGELIAENTGFDINSFDMFLTGMFSLIDKFIDMPMDEILKELPLSKDIKDTLSGRDNINTRILRVIKEYEAGNWDVVDEYLEPVGISGDKIYRCYIEALDWAEKIDL